MSTDVDRPLTADELPALHQGDLDASGLDALFRDLAALSDVIEIICKGAAAARATPGRVSLEDARSRLRAGTVRGVQVRYRYDGAEWWDTILATPTGFRVVRIQQDWGG